MQRIHLLLVLVLSAALLGNVQGREQESSSTGRMVRAQQDSSDYCFVNNTIAKWCFLSKGPFATIGWKTDQTFSTLNNIDYWQITFRPYLEGKIYMASQYTMFSSYYGDFLVDLQKFMANIFGEIIWWKDGNLCFNSGW